MKVKAIPQLFNPCTVCRYKGMCYDECGRLGFAIDQPQAPKLTAELPKIQASFIKI